jgi:urease accessory protein UreF
MLPPMSLTTSVDPMAAQMAQLLAASDLDELREIVERWVATAVTGRERRVYQNFGARMIELKQELARAPVQPTREELELALTMMLRLAAEGGGKPGAP